MVKIILLTVSLFGYTLAHAQSGTIPYQPNHKDSPEAIQTDLNNYLSSYQQAKTSYDAANQKVVDDSAAIDKLKAQLKEAYADLKALKSANRHNDGPDDDATVKAQKALIKQLEQQLSTAQDGLTADQQALATQKEGFDQETHDSTKVIQGYRNRYEKITADNKIDRKLNSSIPALTSDDAYNNLSTALGKNDNYLRTQSSITPAKAPLTPLPLPNPNEVKTQKLTLMKADKKISETPYCAQNELKDSDGKPVAGTNTDLTLKGGSTLSVCSVDGVQIAQSGFTKLKGAQAKDYPVSIQKFLAQPAGASCKGSDDYSASCSKAGGTYLTDDNLCQLVKDDGTSIIDGKSFCEGPSLHKSLASSLGWTDPKAAANKAQLCKDQAAAAIVKELLAGSDKNPKILSQLVRRAALKFNNLMHTSNKNTTNLESYQNANSGSTQDAAAFSTQIQNLYTGYGLQADQALLKGITLDAKQKYQFVWNKTNNANYQLRLNNQNASAILYGLSQSAKKDDPNAITLEDAASVWAMEKLRSDSESADLSSGKKKSDFSIGQAQGNMMNFSTLVYQYNDKDLLRDKITQATYTDPLDQTKKVAEGDFAAHSVIKAAQGLSAEQLKCLTDNPSCDKSAILPADQAKILQSVQSKLNELVLKGTLTTGADGSSSLQNYKLTPSYNKDGTVDLGLTTSDTPKPASVQPQQQLQKVQQQPQQPSQPQQDQLDPDDMDPDAGKYKPL